MPSVQYSLLQHQYTISTTYAKCPVFSSPASVYYLNHICQVSSILFSSISILSQPHMPSVQYSILKHQYTISTTYAKCPVFYSPASVYYLNHICQVSSILFSSISILSQPHMPSVQYSILQHQHTISTTYAKCPVFYSPASAYYLNHICQVSSILFSSISILSQPHMPSVQYSILQHQHTISTTYAKCPVFYSPASAYYLNHICQVSSILFSSISILSQPH